MSASTHHKPSGPHRSTTQHAPGAPAGTQQPAPLRKPHALADNQRVLEVGPTASSGVGVLDKATLILNCLEAGPLSLGQLVAATGLARPTAHRLAVALTHHRLVARDVQGRFMLGPRLAELAAATAQDQLLVAASPVLERLRHATNESAQVYRRQGDWRVCVASAERPVGLRETIPVGTQLSMKAGSAAQVLLAWEDQGRIIEGLKDAHFSAAMLASVRRAGWAQSAGERERGTASVSAPVYSPTGKVIAAISIAGSQERMSRTPGRIYAEAVMEAGAALSAALKNPA